MHVHEIKGDGSLDGERVTTQSSVTLRVINSPDTPQTYVNTVSIQQVSDTSTTSRSNYSSKFVTDTSAYNTI